MYTPLIRGAGLNCFYVWILAKLCFELFKFRFKTFVYLSVTHTQHIAAYQFFIYLLFQLYGIAGKLSHNGLKPAAQFRCKRKVVTT